MWRHYCRVLSNGVEAQQGASHQRGNPWSSCLGEVYCCAMPLVIIATVFIPVWVLLCQLVLVACAFGSGLCAGCVHAPSEWWPRVCRVIRLSDDASATSALRSTLRCSCLGPSGQCLPAHSSLSGSQAATQQQQPSFCQHATGPPPRAPPPRAAPRAEQVIAAAGIAALGAAVAQSTAQPTARTHPSPAHAARAPPPREEEIVRLGLSALGAAARGGLSVISAAANAAAEMNAANAAAARGPAPGPTPAAHAGVPLARPAVPVVTGIPVQAASEGPRC